LKTPQFKHQKVGTEALVSHEAFALFDEMGAGKSKQVIDAACILAEQGKIDTVVVVCPASMRCVWLDKEIGEIKKHAWTDSNVHEYHRKLKHIWSDSVRPVKPLINWIVANYEFLRSGERLAGLCEKLEGRKVLLILDESSYIKNRTAAQTKAVAKLRQHCARCVLLNGTPITNSPLDLWSQMQILDRKILGEYFKDSFYSFRYAYATMRTQRFGARAFQQVVDYKNLGELAQRIAPWVLRREKKDCLDLPEKLYSVREVQLSAASWQRYKELKKDALISLDAAGEKRMEPNAAVRLMRLAQLTSGILGGVLINEHGEENANFEGDVRGAEVSDGWQKTQDLSDEKLKWAVRYLTEECTAKAVIVWTRWRRERERLAIELCGKIAAFQLYGGQSKEQRAEAVKWFSLPKKDEDSRCVLIAQQHAGGVGLNLVAASEAIYLSNDFSSYWRLQSEDRCHRPGQMNPVLYTDVLATGPKGERTIDHVIFKALRDKKDVADLTCAEWKKELSDE
jgi:SNF2 family DNA or RNA helicase